MGIRENFFLSSVSIQKKSMSVSMRYNTSVILHDFSSIMLISLKTESRLSLLEALHSILTHDSMIAWQDESGSMRYCHWILSNGSKSLVSQNIYRISHKSAPILHIIDQEKSYVSTNNISSMVDIHESLCSEIRIASKSFSDSS